MNPEIWERVKGIFAEASELAEADQAHFVSQAAQGDADVEREVLRLLRLDIGAEERLAGLKPPGGLIQSAADLHVLYKGEMLAGRYEIRRFLASGGMGEVYEAEDLELGRPVAIKAIRGELTGDDHVFWLKREVQSARRIVHPNVCRVFDLVEANSASGRPVVFLTMELVRGETLSERLRRDGPMSERQALPLLRQMVAALAAAHRAGIVHRDFKSGNVMIASREGGPQRVVVTDFGLARQIPLDSRTILLASSRSSFACYGTPAYMAPEQIEGGKAGTAADIYALGVVMYEMLTGELPYAEDSPLAMAVKKSRERPIAPQTLAPALRPTWAAAMLRCLESGPRKRFGDVREILTHLETRSPRRLWWKLLRRRHGGKLKIAAAAASMASIAWLGWWLWPPQARARTVTDFERGVFDLQAGEPAQAAQHLESAISQSRLPAVAHAYLALAWHDLGFAARARTELSRAFFKPFQPESDRQFERAAELQVNGHREQSLPLLAHRPADLALLEDQLGRPEAEALWKQVIVKSPNHPAAHLRLAMIEAKTNRWKEAEREFLLAETYFRAQDDAEMVRAVSARRGFARIQSGDMDLARNDLASLGGFLPRPPGSGYGPCERTVTLMAGEADNFAPPWDPIPYINPDFVNYAAWPGMDHLKQFDEPRDDVMLLASIILPPVRCCEGRVELRIRKGRSGYLNDIMNWGSAPLNSGPAHQVWLWAGRPDAEQERLLTWSLSSQDLMDVERAQARKKFTSLDFAIGDDTTVDYIKLTLVY